VTVPLTGEEGESNESGVDRIARQEIQREIRGVADGHVEVELEGSNRAVVWVEEHDISHVIGKGGGRISDIENRLGIEIDVRTFDERPGGKSGSSGGGGGGGGQAVPTGASGDIVTPEITSRHVVVPAHDYTGDTVEVQADGEYLFTATVSRGGEIQVSRGSAIAEELEQAIDRGKQITLVPS
jgi:ATPase